jgi:adenosine deaminase
VSYDDMPSADPRRAYPLPHRPVVELHRHLDGNVRTATVLDLARRHGIRLPADSVEGLRPHVQVTSPTGSLLDFLGKFRWLQAVIADLDAVRRIVRENLEDAVAEGIDYVELRFSPYFMGQVHGLAPGAVAEAACDALEDGLAELPLRAKLIGIVSRTFGADRGWAEVEAAIGQRHRGIVALDLAGDEAGFPGELFVDHFRRARDAGLRLVAHAGEAAGAASVRQAVEELGAERIGHGVRAVEDPAVLDLLAERRVPLEVCPTSNVQTSTVASYAAHPLPALLERGLVVTLNTDDPSISGIDLPHEYRVARHQIGLGDDALAALQENALAAAFLDADERRALEESARLRPGNEAR